MNLKKWIQNRIEEQEALLRDELDTPKELKAVREGRIQAFKQVLMEV